MKFSAAAMALGVAPLALGKAVHDVYPVRRNGHEKGGNSNVSPAQVSAEQILASEAQVAQLEQLIGLNRGSGVSINFLWINVGGGAATTVLGAAQTVTVTQTVNAGGAATAAPPPPAATTNGAAAGTTTAASPPSGTAGAAGGATHSVTVGGPGGLAFDPPQLKATPGDTVIFTFLSQNHTATQSAFNKPCEALSGGMDSGFQANPNNTINPPPQVAMQIMVGTPLWFYCRQKGHCGKGMVFSINPTANKTHAAFQAMAIQQNGQGAGSAITGGGSGAGAGAGTGASASASAGTGTGAAESSSVSLAPLPGATDTATATAGGAGAAATGVVTGNGQVQADGSCLCAVQCSFPGFPNAQVQGRDSFGGFGGAVPMAMVPAMRFRA